MYYDFSMHFDIYTMCKVSLPYKCAMPAHTHKQSTQEGSGKMSDNSSSQDYSSSDDSSSDDEVVLHKPVFLKRNRKVSQETSEKKAKTDGPSAHEQLLKRVEFEASAAAAKEEAAAVVDRDYTTDKELLRRTMALDDRDTVAPESERAQWEVREKRRQQRHRERLVELQRAAEDQEARKLRDPQGTRDITASNEASEPCATVQDKPAPPRHRPVDTRPQRARDHHLSGPLGLSNDTNNDSS